MQGLSDDLGNAVTKYPSEPKTRIGFAVDIVSAPTDICRQFTLKLMEVLCCTPLALPVMVTLYAPAGMPV
jgi:hypothetical protein